MKNLIKFTAVLAAALLTISPATAKSKSVPANISNAPAIEASYDQVQKDIAKHQGVNVRWGGRIIGSQKSGKVTQVTLIAYPLDSDGKPSALEAPIGKAFVVNFDKSTRPRKLAVGNFITVYGPVKGTAKLTNGPLESLVPVVTSQEAKKWKARNIAGLNRGRNVNYNSLAFRDSRFGFRGSRFGFGSSRFGFGSSRFGFGGSRFGFGSRGFSQFGGFSKFGKFSKFGRF